MVCYPLMAVFCTVMHVTRMLFPTGASMWNSIFKQQVQKNSKQQQPLISLAVSATSTQLDKQGKFNAAVKFSLFWDPRVVNKSWGLKTPVLFKGFLERLLSEI
jgi:hypothetical protein